MKYSQINDTFAKVNRIIMMKAGEVYTLTINRFTDNGAYLVDEDFQEVLLPNRYVEEGAEIGGKVEVFVHHDSEDRLVATTERPVAMPGEIAAMEVVGATIHGVFVDWGLPKDLFIPKKNQWEYMEMGRSYPVLVYRDLASGRMVGTTKLAGFIDNEEIVVEAKDEVDIIVARKTETGYRVVVNQRNWGAIYSSELFTPVRVGETLKGYVKRITEDGRIDIMLRREGFAEVKDGSAAQLMQLLEDHGGELPIGDKSAPEQVYKLTGMSKKLFKRTAGHLMKEGQITITDEKTVVSDLKI